MQIEQRKSFIQDIVAGEKLRQVSRARRLLLAPVKTIPYYLIAALGHIKPFRLTFRTPWGKQMTCYLPEGNTFYYYGYCEANLTNFLLRYIREGMTCVDIGAHVGYYSMLLSELVGQNGSVHSFEPTPWTASLLATNTSELTNVRVNNAGVSDSANPLRFTDYGPGYGAYNTAHSNGASIEVGNATNIEVKSMTLNEYCDTSTLTPDFIKIDAEGHEYHILLGADHIIQPKADKKRPLLSFEVAGGASWVDDQKSAIAILISANYEPYEISTDGHLKAHELQDSYEYDNLIFVPRERTLEVRELIS